MSSKFADKIALQNLLFSELSAMFGQEVPLYDKSLLINKECNKVVGAFLAEMYSGFRLSEAQLDKTSSERHGAIRIGRPDEYRWVTKFFAAFGMEPHNFYDMTNVGSKSQPIIATAFRSRLNPEHRIFCSLLMPDYFDPGTRERIQALLATRQVFSQKAKELVEKNEREGGLSESDAKELVSEAVNRIFKWTGKARDFQLYQDLSKAGFKIAADIACFESHHLNHLTPNTFCMDLYTSAMKFCLGEIPADEFKKRAEAALVSLSRSADKDYMRLQFKHLSAAELESYKVTSPSLDQVTSLVAQLATRLQQPDCVLAKLKHSGFKDFTEGPASDTPILLRQDAYKALTEPVTFNEVDGTRTEAAHTARFGEIEQRFYATTTSGRALYDKCLAEAETLRDRNPALKNDYFAYKAAYNHCFAPFPKTLGELLAQKLVHGRYIATDAGIATAKIGGIATFDISELTKRGWVRVEGLRYEDFLPISAAGIFASNLGQYGTKSTAVEKPVYTQGMLEAIMGRKIVDSSVTYAGLEAESILTCYDKLGIANQVPAGIRTQLEIAAGASSQ